MRKLALFPVLALAIACADDSIVQPTVEGDMDLAVAPAVKPAPSLNSTIDYVFVGHLGEVRDGRLLVWVGEFHGGIEGRGEWWFAPNGGPPNMPDQAHVGFYDARWEVWDGDNLLIAGSSAGTTALPKGKDGIWRGKGVVTEGNGAFADWVGRQIYEGGNVNFVFPYSGQGIFRVN